MKQQPDDDFRRGAIAAAGVADAYNSSTTHPYRLGDCILAKMNIGKQKPRRNLSRRATMNPDDTWIIGFSVALAELHRRLLGGNDSASVSRAASGAGITLRVARAAGVSAYDLRELKKAGVR